MVNGLERCSVQDVQPENVFVTEITVSLIKSYSFENRFSVLSSYGQFVILVDLTELAGLYK